METAIEVKHLSKAYKDVPKEFQTAFLRSGPYRFRTSGGMLVLH